MESALKTSSMLLNTRSYEQHIMLHDFLDKLPLDPGIYELDYGDLLSHRTDNFRFIEEFVIEVNTVSKVKRAESGYLYGNISLTDYEEFYSVVFTKSVQVEVLSEHSLIMDMPIYLNSVTPATFTHRDGKFFKLDGCWFISDHYGYQDDIGVTEDDYDDLEFEHETPFGDLITVYSESDDGLLHLPIKLKFRFEKARLPGCTYAIDHFIASNKISWNDGLLTLE